MGSYYLKSLSSLPNRSKNAFGCWNCLKAEKISPGKSKKE